MRWVERRGKAVPPSDIYLGTSGREMANGAYHRETSCHCESLRERKYKLFGDKSKRAEKKAKREQARAMAKANPQIAFLAGAGAFEQMILRKNDVLYTQSGEGSKPLDGVVARVESGSEVESRITLTRLAILGPLALAAPKKKGGEKFVTIEGPDFLWCMEVPRKRASDAVRFAAKVNGQVKELLHQQGA